MSANGSSLAQSNGDGEKMTWDEYDRLTKEELKRAHAKAEADTAELLVEISLTFNVLRNLLRNARTIPDGWSSDGSFGLTAAEDRLDEAEMWANKEIRSRHGVKWP